MGPRQSVEANENDNNAPLINTASNTIKTDASDQQQLLLELDPSFSRLQELGFIHLPVFYNEKALLKYFGNNNTSKAKEIVQKLILPSNKNNNNDKSNKMTFTTFPSWGQFNALDEAIRKSCATKENPYPSLNNPPTGDRDLLAGPYVRFSDETADAVVQLRNKLLMEVGDDILAGTLFCPTGGSSNRALDGGPSFDIKIFEHTTTSDNQTKNNNKKSTTLTIPASSLDVASLYCNEDFCKTSHLGVEGRGTIQDDRLRKSREILCSNMELPEFLNSSEGIHKYFPEQVEAIRNRLAASSGDLYFEKYKLCIYKPQDFFKKHQDSVEKEDHCATLLIHLPCIGDFIDPQFSRRHVDLQSFDLSNSDDFELSEEQLRDNLDSHYSGDGDIEKGLENPNRRKHKSYRYKKSGQLLYHGVEKKRLLAKRKKDKTSLTEDEDFETDESNEGEDSHCDESSCDDTDDVEQEGKEGKKRDDNTSEVNIEPTPSTSSTDSATAYKKKWEERQKLFNRIRSVSQLYCHLTDEQLNKLFKDEEERRNGNVGAKASGFLSSIVEKVKKDGIMSLLTKGFDEDNNTDNETSKKKKNDDADDDDEDGAIGQGFFYQQEDQFWEEQRSRKKESATENAATNSSSPSYIFDPFSMSPHSNLLSQNFIKQRKQNIANDFTKYEKRVEGGTLQFFVGRDVTPDNKTFLYGRPDFRTPLRSSAQFCASVLLQNYDRDELLHGEMTSDPAFANLLAASNPPGTAERKTDSSYQYSSILNSSKTRTENCLKYPKEQRKHLPLHFAAFLTNILHRVRPIRRGVRMTLQYKVYRRGPSASPLWGNCLSSSEKTATPHLKILFEVENLVDKLVDQLKKDIASSNDSRKKLGFGICLRHEYAPAALKPKNLKGIDYKIHHLISKKYECILSSTSQHRSSYGGRSWVIRDKLNRCIVPTLEKMELFDESRARHNAVKSLKDNNDEETDDNNSDEQECKQKTISASEALKQSLPSFGRDSQRLPAQPSELSETGENWFQCLPTIRNVAFMDLGLGKMNAGGVLLGNWDSSFYYFTRQTILICTLEESAWSRRKVLLRMNKENEKWANEEKVLKIVASFL